MFETTEEILKRLVSELKRTLKQTETIINNEDNKFEKDDITYQKGFYDGIENTIIKLKSNFTIQEDPEPKDCENCNETDKDCDCK